jgi:hypothetical protein
MTETSPPNSPAAVAAQLGTALPAPPSLTPAGSVQPTSTSPPGGVSITVSVAQPATAAASAPLPPGTAEANAAAFSASNVVKDIKAEAAKVKVEATGLRKYLGWIAVAVILLAAAVAIIHFA